MKITNLPALQERYEKDLLWPLIDKTIQVHIDIELLAFEDSDYVEELTLFKNPTAVAAMVAQEVHRFVAAATRDGLLVFEGLYDTKEFQKSIYDYSIKNLIDAFHLQFHLDKKAITEENPAAHSLLHEGHTDVESIRYHNYYIRNALKSYYSDFVDKQKYAFSTVTDYFASINSNVLKELLSSKWAALLPQTDFVLRELLKDTTKYSDLELLSVASRLKAFTTRVLQAQSAEGLAQIETLRTSLVSADRIGLQRRLITLESIFEGEFEACTREIKRSYIFKPPYNLKPRGRRNSIADHSFYAKYHADRNALAEQYKDRLQALEADIEQIERDLEPLDAKHKAVFQIQADRLLPVTLIEMLQQKLPLVEHEIERRGYTLTEYQVPNMEIRNHSDRLKATDALEPIPDRALAALLKDTGAKVTKPKRQRTTVTLDVNSDIAQLEGAYRECLETTERLKVQIQLELRECLALFSDERTQLHNTQKALLRKLRDHRTPIAEHAKLLEEMQFCDTKILEVQQSIKSFYATYVDLMGAYQLSLKNKKQLEFLFRAKKAPIPQFSETDLTLATHLSATPNLNLAKDQIAKRAATYKAFRNTLWGLVRPAPVAPSVAEAVPSAPTLAPEESKEDSPSVAKTPAPSAPVAIEEPTPVPSASKSVAEPTPPEPTAPVMLSLADISSTDFERMMSTSTAVPSGTSTGAVRSESVSALSDVTHVELYEIDMPVKVKRKKSKAKSHK